MQETTTEETMTILSRRSILAGVAAGAATTAFGWAPRAFALAPPAGKQAASFYRYKLGSMEITVLSDGVARVPVTDAFIPNVKTEEVKAALADAFMDPNVFIGPYNPIVINTGSRMIVVDMGTGEANFKATNGVAGQLLTNMAAAGIDPKAIDTVLISHYHGDHINGLLRADNSLTYPNAEVLVPAPEHKYWMDDGEMSRSSTQRIADNFKNVRRVMSGEVLKRLRTYEWDKEVLPGITAVGTPGHTPGHTSHIVSSGPATVYVQADVTHAPFLFARHPGWHAFYDHEPVQAEATRRKVYDMLAAEKLTVQGFHYPFPSVAHVEKTANGYREVPIPWNPSL
jgi:glyoxylase-like metal-dependent hydrolase (beta-lactamase superfamily II)